MIFEFILMVAISNLILAGVLAFNRHVKEINSWVMRALMILIMLFLALVSSAAALFIVQATMIGG